MKSIVLFCALAFAFVAQAVTTPTDIPVNAVPSTFRTTAIGRINSLVDTTKRHSIAVVYDVASHGGAVGDNSTSDTLPSGAMIVRSYGYINTAFSSSGSTVALYCGTANNIFTAATLSGSAQGTILSGSSNGQEQNFKKISADCTIKANLAAATHTAGKLTMFIEYIINSY